MGISLPQLIISVVLFFVLFYGISFLLNMVLKETWIMLLIYPFIVMMIIDKIDTIEYFTNTQSAFKALLDGFINMKLADIIMLSSGLFGVIAAGFTMKYLRKSGYQMF
ncbi:YuiB family protein [Abyssicoccus albus]|uniref:YuiB-like putative membrane protein n=1 Tax=Abyssicoccus albus TaxID=1817405 RepID=A0A3N5BIV9_9BACL|nr:YuiB family protein [Abyssicoccus albus]RPF57567.1 YuiB-like putative membrane protein [Abyssicoccus albus]